MPDKCYYEHVNRNLSFDKDTKSTKESDIDWKLKLCFVCSHGGHLFQLIKLKEALGSIASESFFLTYIGGEYLLKNTEHRRYEIKNIGNNPLKLIANLLHVARIFTAEKPDVAISTGAEIAIPAFILAKLMRMTTIYIESISSREKPRRTGRVVYHLSDHFFVQSRALLRKYGSKARYEGTLL